MVAGPPEPIKTPAMPAAQLCLNLDRGTPVGFGHEAMLAQRITDPLAGESTRVHRVKRRGGPEYRIWNVEYWGAGPGQ